MVQSIWLEFDEEEMNEEMIDEIVKTINENYKTFSTVGIPKKSTFSNSDVHGFNFIDCQEIVEILKKVGLEVDDEKRCDCGCYNTDFEMLVGYISLEFMHGQMNGSVDDVYFRVGRDITMSVGMYGLRLNILRYILEDIQEELDKKGINSEMNFGDCDRDHFESYDYWNESKGG